MNDLALGLRGVQLGKGVQALLSPEDMNVTRFEYAHPKGVTVLCSRRIRKPSWLQATSGQRENKRK